MSKLLPVFYLPPVSWFAEFLAAGEVVLEQHENFPKQTYRNRANIYGANGKLSLIIPISHGGNRALKDTKVCNRENWQSLHWKSINTAYQTSAYFEYYEDRLAEIYHIKTDHLLEFNLHALEVIQRVLQTEQAYRLTTSYETTPEAEDFRAAFSPKQPTAYDTPEYFQSFSSKYGFLPDLSVLDLICNKGPEARTYIKSILNP